jgi:hypothetical protein
LNKSRNVEKVEPAWSLSLVFAVAKAVGAQSPKFEAIADQICLLLLLHPSLRERTVSSDLEFVAFTRQPLALVL